MRRVWGLLWRAFLFLLITLVVAEAALQVAALLVRGREGGGKAGAHRVLCIGDSHTYGALVPAEESYPGHLQRLLDEQAPGAYAVVNLGIPGQSTTQVRNRLRAAIGSLRPELIVVWCGVNNAWNRRESTAATGSLPWSLDGVLSHLRLYRLVRVWQHDLKIEAGRYDITMDPGDPEKNFVIRMDGRTEHVQYEDSGFRADAEMERRAEADYRAMVADAHAAAIPIAFIAYPLDEGAFSLANRAVRRVAAESRAPLVEAGRVAQRVPKTERALLWAGHPNGRMYAEVARDLVPVVLSGGTAAAGPAVDAVIARIGFEAAADAGASSGPCARIATGCAEGAGCYRWNPERAVCNVQAPLAEPVAAVRASLRLRVAEPPAGADGHDVFGVFEDSYGTGVYLELVDGDRLGVGSLGRAGALAHCGPLAARLRRGVWYAVEVRAEKADEATVTLTLRSAEGAVLDSTTCAAQPSGGGYFTRVMLGNGNPAGSTADVALDDAEVRAAAPPAPGR